MRDDSKRLEPKTPVGIVRVEQEARHQRQLKQKSEQIKVLREQLRGVHNHVNIFASDMVARAVAWARREKASQTHIKELTAFRHSLNEKITSLKKINELLAECNRQQERTVSGLRNQLLTDQGLDWSHAKVGQMQIKPEVKNDAPEVAQYPSPYRDVPKATASSKGIRIQKVGKAHTQDSYHVDGMRYEAWAKRNPDIALYVDLFMSLAGTNQ